MKDTPKTYTFDDFIRLVDRRIGSLYGISLDDLPDYDLSHFWDEDFETTDKAYIKEVVSEAIEEISESTGLEF